jgi:hypothetical protein
MAWWFWAAWLLVGILCSVLVFKRRRKVLQDMLAELVYLAALFAIITCVLQWPTKGVSAAAAPLLPALD